MSWLKSRSAFRCVVVFVVMLAMMGCKSGVKPQNTNPTQPAASSANPAPTGPVSAKKEPISMVAIPDDIRCSVEGMSFESVVKNGTLVNTNGAVSGVTCWITARKPILKKRIPLASTAIKDGMLPTKLFGNLQITPENNVNSNGIYMAIGSDKLQAFREYLQG